MERIMIHDIQSFNFSNNGTRYELMTDIADGAGAGAGLTTALLFVHVVRTAMNEAAPFALAIVVSASILGIVSLSAVVGAVLPLIIKRVGLDPAVSSTPFIASVVDVLGLMVYFGVAQYVFSVTS